MEGRYDMKKRLLGSVVLILSLGGIIFGATKDVSAHGYVREPISRGYQGSLDARTNWTAAFQKYGAVINEPQSLEALKGFPAAGPADGRIASANGALGFQLDQQTSTLWTKQDISTGPNNFTWHFTANHRTAKYHYYITKNGWDQNKPLAREDLELLSEFDGGGQSSANISATHTVNIPEDRMGYHVILAIWDISDTANAFYNVIDANIKSNGAIPVVPNKPTNVRAVNTTKQSVSLSWDAQAAAEKYNVYRDGQLITTTSANNYQDNQLTANTTYKYEIEAVSFTGQVSEKSDALQVTTLADNEVEVPTRPGNLHSMGETVNSISLMWNPSSHSAGIKTYEIYRDGQLVGQTANTTYLDTGLNAGTQYTYTIKAVSNDSIRSEASNRLVISTKTNEITPPSEHRQFELGSLTNPVLYTKDEIIFHEGKLYTTLVTHYNYGDPSWAPDSAASLFRIK